MAAAAAAALPSQSAATCPMKGLIDQCTFFAGGEAWQKNVAEPSMLSRAAVAASAATAEETAPGQQTTIIAGTVVTSVSMSERKQRDVSGAFYCGARTLFVDAAHCTRVILRGANKFFDLPVALTHASRDFLSCVSPAAAPCCASHQLHCTAVLALRKAAGFFCMFFPDVEGGSSDGQQQQKLVLRCCSKHSLVGVHVDAAEAAMKQHLSALQLDPQQLAARLQQLGDAALLCECIGGDPSVLGAHPVNDSDLLSGGDPHSLQLVCFALQRRNTVIEWSFPHSVLVDFAKEFQLYVAPQLLMSSSAGPAAASSCGDIIFNLVKRASTTTGFVQKDEKEVLHGEGAVLLIETASQQQQQIAPLVRPIRLKIKTVQYQTLRQLRSLLVDVSLPSGGLFPLTAAIALWLAERHRASCSTPEIQPLIDPSLKLPRSFTSWEEVMVQFQQDAQHPPAAALLQELDTDACLRHRTALLCPRLLVLLAGLPATGKSSFSRSLSEMLMAAFPRSAAGAGAAGGGGGVDQFIVVERDSFVPQLPDGSSNHAQRAARRSAHRGFFRALRTPSEFSPRGGLQVVVADACHAGRGARATTRDCARPYRRGATVFLACEDRRVLVKRIVKRTAHAVLGAAAGADVAEKAIFDVASALEVPAPGEAAPDLLFRFDAAQMSTTAMAERVVGEFITPEVELFRSDWRRCSNNGGGGGDNREDDSEVWRKVCSLAGCPRELVIRSGADLLSRCCPPQRRVSTVRLVDAAGSGEGTVEESSSWLAALSPCLRATLANVGNEQAGETAILGHTKWVRPYFLQQHANENASLFDALLQKLSVRPSPCHVTIRHVADFAVSRTIPDVERWMMDAAAGGDGNGKLFSVQPTHLLLSRSFIVVQVKVAAVSGGASPSQEDKSRSGEEEAEEVAATPGTFFHITIAHSDKVTAGQALSRFAPIVLPEGGQRRGRPEEKDADLQQQQPLSKRQQKKAQGDTHYCVLPLVVPKDDRNSDSTSAATVPELFGVIECV